MPKRSIRRRKTAAKAPPISRREVARRLTSKRQRVTGQTRAKEHPQKRHRIGDVEPAQGPRVRAESSTSLRRTLSSEARELLAKVAEGGIPLMMTQNLERIAREHGITVGKDTTPDYVIRLLRRFARTGGTDRVFEKARTQPDIFANIIWPDTSDSNRDE